MRDGKRWRESSPLEDDVTGLTLGDILGTNAGVRSNVGLKCSHRQEGETHTERGRKEI